MTQAGGATHQGEGVSGPGQRCAVLCCAVQRASLSKHALLCHALAPFFGVQNAQRLRMEGNDTGIGAAGGKGGLP